MAALQDVSAIKTALTLKKLNAGYDKTPVIRDISFSVEAGDIFGLIGLNGAGKTTMIKTMLGLRAQQSGDIWIFDRPSSDKGAHDFLSYLPERFEPPWFLSGIEFLRFSLKLYGKKLDNADYYEAAKSLYLDPAALDRKVQSYSKGMRQKLGLLGTIMTGCPLLILDEPMSGLDPVARSLVKDMLIDCKKQGRTIFLSSHILADMDEICDEVAVLHDGVIRFRGKPENLKADTDTTHLERAFLKLIDAA